ncbi:hypothetical protein CDA63_18935 [Hymenobacter amundsenii]|uniref:Uncharacterized protein n=1 Tax=Hymenobacter amundsenii TaxID=2006685 RepID=A0A246FG75_9BACT|nr:hypothetical protein [Hymenobacter amundsenii]OWP61540.1 hypothetical protein CDA63_18935 [Hymenobacter amundsenii]
MQSLTDSFLMQCRENFFRGITPSGSGAETAKKALVALFRGLTAASQMETFVGFLQEGHYYINLWAAHLLVEHYRPDGPTWKLCMEIIESHAMSTINPKVAQEELECLRNQAQS